MVLLSPSMRSECLKQLFVFAEKDETIQKKWWALPTIISNINRLNKLSPETQLIPGVPRDTTYTTRDMLLRLRKDCSGLLAQSPVDFGTTTKQIFLRTFKIDNKNCTAIYLDLSVEEKVVPYDHIKSPHGWFQELFQKRYSIVKLVPLGIYHMVNPWYSTELEKQFASRDGETAREACQAMHDLLAKAQRSSEEAKKLTEGLQKGQKVFYLDGIGADDGKLEMKFNPVAVANLAARHREMAMYMRKALSLALGVDAENAPVHLGECCRLAVAAIQDVTNDGRLTKSNGGVDFGLDRSIETTAFID